MEFIIEFYKELDTLNLIIFWGIIIVIILLLIFSMILINKNKKLKQLVDSKMEIEEELAIIKQEEVLIEKNNQENETRIEIQETIEPKKNITREEEIIEYRQKIFELSSNNEIIKKTERPKEEKKVEMPTGPYQKNVLREMSLSQTSPIGINRETNKINNKMEIVKDLDESLNEEKIEKTFDIELKEKETLEKIKDSNESVKKDISRIDKYNKNNEYLEEVSRKLAEAEIPDEIERTNYELQQEEDAIISYKELMEKKDSIQTIDEEEAIISIEELMNRNNKNETKEEISKLYNISEEEENEKFIKELKQFRNDL